MKFGLVVQFHFVKGSKISSSIIITVNEVQHELLDRGQ